jgi:hypothetical protein
MGRAFTAVAEGAMAVWWNPGALGLTEGIHVSPVSYNESDPSMTGDDSWLWPIGVAAGAGGFGVGVYLGRLNYAESEDYDEIGSGHRKFTPKERTATVGAGGDLSRFLNLGTDRMRLGLGVSGNFVHIKYVPDWESGGGLGESSWDLDVGLLGLYTISAEDASPDGADASFHPSARHKYSRLRGGVVMHNVFDRRIDMEDQHESRPLGNTLRLGGAIETGSERSRDKPDVGHSFHGMLSFDVERLMTYPDFKTIYHVGIEGGVLSFLTLRLGRIEDREGDSVFTVGGGLGGDGPSQGGGFGGRLDLAGVPYDYYGARLYATLSVWYGF